MELASRLFDLFSPVDFYYSIIKSLLFGSSLTSLPFVNYGGVMADSAEAGEALVVAARTGGPAPIAFREIVDSHLASYAVLESLRTGVPSPVRVDEFWAGVEAGDAPDHGEGTA